MASLIGHSVTYRIATGPRQGRKVLTLQSLPAIDESLGAEAGSVAGAGLDVFVSEPVVGEHLTSLDNVLLLPHVGTATTETRDEMGLRVIENIKTFLSTGQPHDRVER